MEPHFRAKVRALSTKEGGRKTAFALSRYRPDLSFEDDRTCYYGAHPVPDEDDVDFDSALVEAGETRSISFWIRSAASQVMPRLRPGSRFRVMEGSRAVADGEVTTIYRTGDS